MARAQDTITARAALPAMQTPDLSNRSPWGVPAFFLATGSNGEITWNRYRELRGQVDFSVGGPRSDVYFGGEVSHQQGRTFERGLGYLPVGKSVPPAAASTFSPTSAAGYVGGQPHGEDFGLSRGGAAQPF